MKTVAIVQARWNSSRFQGKILEKIDNLSVLGHVLTRLKKTKELDLVCCAIPDHRSSYQIKIEAKKFNVEVYEGSENNVLERFYMAAMKFKADFIMRVTSDCPFTDFNINSYLLKLIKNKNLEYITNNMPPTFPHGLDCEIFNFASLKNAFMNSKTNYEKEHVTPWIKNNSKFENFENHLGNHHQIRLTLDYKDDLSLLKKVYFSLKTQNLEINNQNIIELFKKNNSLYKINRKYNKFIKSNISC